MVNMFLIVLSINIPIHSEQTLVPLSCSDCGDYNDYNDHNDYGDYNNYDIFSTNYHIIFDTVALIQTLSTYIKCVLEHEKLLLCVYSVSFVNKNMNERRIVYEYRNPNE